MTGSVWKVAKQSRATTNNRSSEIARVILFSLLLAVVFQFPMAALNNARASSSSFIGSVGPEAASEQSNEAPALLQQQAFQPTSIPHYAFIKFSSYRVSLRTFYVVGISSTVVREWDKKQVVHSCEWHPANRTRKIVHKGPEDFVVANASMLYIPFDENGMTYVSAIVNCTFHDNVGVDGNGGLLVLRVSLSYHRWEKNVPAIVHDELAGEVNYFLNSREEVHILLFWLNLLL